MVNQSERVLLMRTQLDVSVYSRSSTRTILGGMPVEWRKAIAIYRVKYNIMINEGYEECTVFSEFAGLFSKQSNGGDVIRC